MASVTLSTEAKLTVSPATLRDWANKMEQMWPNLKVGDSTRVTSVSAKQGFNISIYLDQQWFEKEERKSRITHHVGRPGSTVTFG